MKPEERAQFILGQLNTGLRTEWSQIEGLEATLENLLHEAKSRAETFIPADKRGAWDAAWTLVHRKLDAIRTHAAEARRRLEGGKPGSPLESWNQVNEHDRELDAALDSLRVMGREALPGRDLEPWYDGWKGLWVTVDDKLSQLRAHVIATRFRLQMRQDYGAEKADEVTRQILAHLPADASLADAERYAAEYRIAHHVVEEHREHPTLRDIIRGLFLLPEDTPEDVLSRQRRAAAKVAAAK